jgi:hypothetical protein
MLHKWKLMHERLLTQKILFFILVCCVSSRMTSYRYSTEEKT